MSCEGSSPITSRCPGSQGRQESTHPTPPCLSRACLGWASSSASILLPLELDIHPSAWKGHSANFVCMQLSGAKLGRREYSPGRSIPEYPLGVSRLTTLRRINGRHTLPRPDQKRCHRRI